MVSWWSYSTPLWYAQRVEGRRPDIVIVDDRTRLDEDLGVDPRRDRRQPRARARSTLLRDSLAAIPDLADRYEIEYLLPEDQGVLIHVLGRRDAA